MATLTDGANNETRSLFSNTQVATGGNFTASFTYTAGGARAADGFGFVLQQQAVTALGGGGGGKAYSGLTPSAAVLFNIYTGGAPTGIIGTSFVTNGANPADNNFDPVAPVNLASGNPINITIVYNAGLQTLTVTLAEQNTANTFTRVYSANLASVFNGNPAWLGFTGATGGANAIQTISNFSYTSTSLTSTVLTVNNATAFSGLVGESGGARNLTVAGLGTLTLSNPSNVYSGGTTLNTTAAGAPVGSLVIGSATALGTGTLTLTAGTLQVGGAFAIPNAVTLNGGLVVFGGSNAITFNGAATLANATTTVLQANTVTTFNGVIGSGNLAYLGGSSTLTLAGTSTYTGSTIVSAGNLVLAGNSALTGTTNVTLNQGGTLTLDNTGTNLADRINDSATVTLNGGTLIFLGNASANSTETLGAVTAAAGSSVIKSVNGSSASATLTLTSLARSAGAALSFQAGSSQTLGSANNQIIVNQAPSALLTNGIIKGVTVADATTFSGNTTGFNLATATGSSTSSIGALTTYQTLSTTGGNAATDNVLVTASTALTANDTVNAALLVGDAINISGAVTLNLGSGTLASTGGTSKGNTVSVATLALGSQEGILNANSGATTINSAITGTGGLTFAGTGSLALPTANSITGAIALDGASLSIGSATTIGTGTLSLLSGSLSTSASAGVLLTNPLTFNNSAVTLAGTNPLLFSGSAALNGTNNTLTVTNTAPTNLNGVISGAGFLSKAGTGTLILSNNANTYGGLTFVNQGVLQVQGSAALGATTAAAVVQGGASVQVLGNGLTIAKPIVLNGTGVNGTGALENLIGGGNTWSGPITLQSDSSIGADGGTTLTQSGIVGGVANLTKVGIGTLILNAANVYTGTTTIGNGVLSAQSNAGSLGLVVGGVVVNSGATLGLQTTVAAKALTLNGTGFGNSGALPQGALVNQANNNTWGGEVTLSGTLALTAGTIPLLAASNTAHSSAPPTAPRCSWPAPSAAPTWRKSAPAP